MPSVRRTRSALVAIILVASACVAVRGVSAHQQGDPDHRREARVIESIAAHIPTDSLARLYTVALDAPEEQSRTIADAVSCQTIRLEWQFGNIAARQAIGRMEDSVLATPALRQRWSEARDRWPAVSGIHFDCVRGLVPAADSLSE
ncbi:MAG TPA: hypothetical protein VHM30_14655 [Gemmatimonadaceae bacterium]|nr:hypothetical protein [Gemmatimonadaceae bacterium]